MRSKLLSMLVTIAVVAGGVGAFVLTRGDAATYSLTAEIDQAPNLFAGGRVMVRGVDVGRIASVVPTEDAVRLTLEIREGVDVPADATLAVIPVTVISDRYVQLFPAYTGGPTLQDGDHIPAERTSIPAELDDVLTQLQGLLEALEPRKEGQRGALARLIDSLDKVFANRSDDLAGTLEGGATVLENLADSERDLTGIIQNLDRVFFALANRSSEIGIVNERFQLVAEALLADQDNLEGTIENIAFLSDEVADVLDSSGDEIGSSFGRLARVLKTLLRHQGSLKKGIQWSNVVAQQLGAVDGSGKGIYAYTGRQVAPGAPGSEYNYRIDSRDTNSCERLQNLADSLTAVIPNSTVDDITDSALSHIPDYYDDDLRFLIRLLIDECTDLPGRRSLSDPEDSPTSTVEGVAAAVGSETLLGFIGRWLVPAQGAAP